MNRNLVKFIQTPQCFEVTLIKKAYAQVYDINFTDDADIYFEANKGIVSLVDVNATADGQDGIGIAVTAHYGNVELNRVKANNNGYHGAIVHLYSSTGSTKVTNSEFNHNLLDVANGWGYDDSPWNFDGWWDDLGVYDQEADYTGLILGSWNGPVTLNGVEVSDNPGSGAYIAGWASPVTVKNSVFNNNDGSGLWV